MDKEIFELRFVSHFRKPVSEIKELGFVEIKRMSKRLRMTEDIDSMSVYRYKYKGINPGHEFSRLKSILVEHTGLLFSDCIEYGKRCVGHFEMVNRNHTIYMWK